MRRQIRQLDVVAVANHCRALHHPFQFQIVARPQVERQLGHHFVIHPKATLKMLLQRAQMVFDQQRNIAQPLAQRRDQDFERLQAVK